MTQAISVTNEFASRERLLSSGIVRITGKDHLYRLAAFAADVRAKQYPGRTMYITAIFDTATNSYLVATTQKACFKCMSGPVTRYRAVRFSVTSSEHRANQNVLEAGLVPLDVEFLNVGRFKTVHYDLQQPRLMRRGLVDATSPDAGVSS